MTALDIVKTRTQIPSDQALVYIQMAEVRASSYTGISDFTDYPSEIAQIAMYLYMEDTIRDLDDAAGGVSSESYSEGGVSISKTYGDLTTKTAECESNIMKVLRSIKERTAGRLRFI